LGGVPCVPIQEVGQRGDGLFAAREPSIDVGDRKRVAVDKSGRQREKCERVGERIFVDRIFHEAYAAGSRLGGKDHLPNISDDLGRLSTEYAIVDEAPLQACRSCPSTHGPRRVLVRDIHVKVLVANDLEQCDLAVVPHGAIRREASNGLSTASTSAVHAPVRSFRVVLHSFYSWFTAYADAARAYAK